MRLVRQIAGWVLLTPICALMLFSAYGKLAGQLPDNVKADVVKLNLEDDLKMIAVGEAATALLLLIPATSSLGVLLASSFWGGAILFHMTQHESYAFQSILLIATWTGAALREPAVVGSFLPKK